MKGQMSSMGVKVPSELREQLRKICKPRLLTESDIVREALLEYLERRGYALQCVASAADNKLAS